MDGDIREQLTHAAIAIMRRANAWSVITINDHEYAVGSLPGWPVCVWEGYRLLLSADPDIDTWRHQSQEDGVPSRYRQLADAAHHAWLEHTKTHRQAATS